jgi:PEGA domain-containing protein
MAFRDGLGERRRTTDASGAAIETLCLRRELAVVPSFEFALRERLSRLSSFRHAYYGHVRSVERSSEFDQALTITSDATSGIRLSALLDTSFERRLPVELGAALCLVRQLVPAVAILHETARDAAHGALGPERLLVAPNGRLVIVEYVLGSALEQLLFSRERYWTELRIALPRVAGLPRFDHLGDVTQIGVVALSLILGRTLRGDEYPSRVGDLVASATATSPTGDAEPLPPALRAWLLRALQLDTRHSFPSAIEARVEFEKVLADTGCDASPESLDRFLARHSAPSLEELPAPVPPAPTKPILVASDVREIKPQLPVTPDIDVSQDPSEPVPPPAWLPRGRFLKVAAAVAVLVVVAGGVLAGARRYLADTPAPTTTGTLVVTTNPAGAQAFVDGVHRGSTPLTLTLVVGSHNVELRGAGDPRVIPVTITPGVQMAQYVDMPPAGAAVDEHPNAAPGSPPSAAAAAAAAAAGNEPMNAPGWIAMAGKLEVQLYEGGRLLGNSKIDRIMVPAGRHDLELVNESIGYRGTRSVQVSPDKVTTVTIDPPKGSIAINALPWAEVWLDGAKIGDTPIGNLAVAAGPHDVIFRHPDLGEHRQTVLVTLNAPLRLSVDMRTP